MALKPANDEAVVRELAHDLSEQIILAPGVSGTVEEQYHRMARKLYAAGWRKPNTDDWITIPEDGSGWLE